MKLLLPLLIVLLAGPAAAHELKSSVLWLDEGADGTVAARLRAPVTADGSAAAIVPRLSGACRALGEMRVTREAGAVVREWPLACDGGLAGVTLRLEGLDPRAPDAIVVAKFADGRELTQAVDRHDPQLTLGVAAAPATRLAAYVPIGAEHILLGADHLLFVLGLVLVVAAAGHGIGQLVAALTAFTVAHSLALASATLGFHGLSPRAVEVLIALSIVVLALELAGHDRRRAAGLPPTLSLSRPWLAAFAFGLLHGLGFAGALASVGLPEGARLWALLLFNLGVELGQLAFVAALLAGAALLRRTGLPMARGIAVAATLLGGVAAYWTLDRFASWAGAFA